MTRTRKKPYETEIAEHHKAWQIANGRDVNESVSIRGRDGIYFEIDQVLTRAAEVSTLCAVECKDRVCKGLYDQLKRDRGHAHAVLGVVPKPTAKNCATAAFKLWFSKIKAIRAGLVYVAADGECVKILHAHPNPAADTSALEYALCEGQKTHNAGQGGAPCEAGVRRFAKADARWDAMRSLVAQWETKGLNPDSKEIATDLASELGYSSRGECIRDLNKRGGKGEIKGLEAFTIQGKTHWRTAT